MQVKVHPKKYQNKVNRTCLCLLEDIQVGFFGSKRLVGRASILQKQDATKLIWTTSSDPTDTSGGSGLGSKTYGFQISLQHYIFVFVHHPMDRLTLKGSGASLQTICNIQNTKVWIHILICIQEAGLSFSLQLPAPNPVISHHPLLIVLRAPIN